MKFKVGDVCLTQRSRVPLLNNNLLVVVVGTTSKVITKRGERCPYLIRRIDGLAFPLTNSDHWYLCYQASVPARMLHKPEDGDLPKGLTRVVAEPESDGIETNLTLEAAP